MRKLVVSEFVSLDGVFEDPGGAEKTAHGGWSLKAANDEYQQYKFDELLAADMLLLGRKTYDGFATAWPTMQGTGAFGEKMNSMPKYVLTSRREELSWQNSHMISGDPIAAIQKLKAEDGGDILVAGSGELVRLLLNHGLVDKLCLMIHPVILGSGKQLLAGVDYQTLKLIDTKVFQTGTVVLEYFL